jgi:hypothetical protein
MDKASPAAFKEMVRVMKFLLGTKDYGLRIQPGEVKDQWSLSMYTDSDWAGDKENRRSVTGFVIFLSGVPIYWRSKLQKSVSLSSSEAEYYALSEAAKEIKFVVQLLESVHVKVKFPIMVKVDNIGAIFMAENNTATGRTRHIDARYHFVREFVEEGYIKVIFVKTEENRSDMMTKNVSSDVYDKHVAEFIVSRAELDPHIVTSREGVNIGNG